MILKKSFCVLLSFELYFLVLGDIINQQDGFHFVSCVFFFGGGGVVFCFRGEHGVWVFF